MFISFAWTSDAFATRNKDMTRRYWKQHHALKFKQNMIVDAMDKLPYRGGKKIGEIKILKLPYQQRTGQMTETDYRREGLLWMEQNNKTIKGKKPRLFYEDWKEKNELVWVVEFETIFTKLDDIPMHKDQTVLEV